MAETTVLQPTPPARHRIATSAFVTIRGSGPLNPLLADWSPPTQLSPRRPHARQASTASTISSFPVSRRSARSRSATQSTAVTSIRPSTSTDRSEYAPVCHGSAPASPALSDYFYSGPTSLSATDLSSSPTSHTPIIPPTNSSWKTVVRKASGKFRRSSSTASLALPTDPSPPRKDRVRSASHNDSIISEEGQSGSVFNLLGRRKSSTNLKAEKKRQQQWDNLPPSPSTFGLATNKDAERKGAFRLGKSKQRLEQVQISPFHIDFDESMDLSASAMLHVPNRSVRRSSSETSFRVVAPVRPSHLPRSNSTNVALEYAHLRNTSNRSPPPPSPLSTASSDFSDGDRHIPPLDIPPVPPLPLELRGQSLQASTSTHRSATVSSRRPSGSSSSRPSMDHRSRPSGEGLGRPSEDRIKFPSFLNFVSRPEDEEPDELGSSASALDYLPASILAPPARPRPRDSSLSGAPSKDGYVPPRRSESLFKPLESASGRIVHDASSGSQDRGKGRAGKDKDRLASFEDLLAMPQETVKISLTPKGAR